MQPSGLSRARRRATTQQTPFGRTKSGTIRQVARGTGFKKIFGYINLPMAIYNLAHKAKTIPVPVIKRETPATTVGFD